MSETIDISILEILSSKICHDLISPIGAVNNGIEFMQEMGEDAGEEATDLIAFSANQASAKLKAYRMAYGAGGADDSIKPEDVYNAIQDMVGAENKIVQRWDAYGELGYGDNRPAAFCKLLISALILAMDCLPKGGELIVEAGDNTGTTLIRTEGENSAIRDYADMALDLTLPRQDLEPKYVHAYVTGLLARNYGYSIAMVDQNNGGALITLTHPNV